MDKQIFPETRSIWVTWRPDWKQGAVWEYLLKFSWCG